jgi:hypothetical protein
MDDILRRSWENMVGRSIGPMNLRLVIQTAVAGRPAFLWAAITNPAYRHELLRQGARDVGKVFVVSVVLDAAYQLIVERGVFLLELLVVATVLAIVPYVLIRGPVSRLATALRQRTDRGAWPQRRTTR